MTIRTKEPTIWEVTAFQTCEQIDDQLEYLIQDLDRVPDPGSDSRFNHTRQLDDLGCRLHFMIGMIYLRLSYLPDSSFPDFDFEQNLCDRHILASSPKTWPHKTRTATSLADQAYQHLSSLSDLVAGPVSVPSWPIAQKQALDMFRSLALAEADLRVSADNLEQALLYLNRVLRLLINPAGPQDMQLLWVQTMMKTVEFAQKAWI